MKRLYLLWMILALAAPVVVRAAADAPAIATVEAEERRGDAEANLYEEGHDAIDDEEWTHAIDVFRKVVAMKGKRTDAALYWLAYAQDKAGRGAEALQTIGTLKNSYPNSRWIRDAKTLEIEIKQDAGEHPDPSKIEDEELKLIVIQNLLTSNPERALPLLQKIVDGPYSKRVKKQALFVLTQSSSPQAAQMIASIARGGAHPELQTEAIRFLGVAGKGNVGLLAEVYQSTPNTEVKKEILRAYMVAGAKTQVLAAARSEKDPHLRAEAIRQLGVMGGAQELREMYRAESSPQVKKTIIESIFVSGGGDVLLDLARSESDPSVRAQAVRTLGLLGREKTGAALVSLYQSNTEASVRRAALDGLFVQNNARALVELARQEKDPKWKREIVSKLAVMNSKEAADYLSSLLE